MRNPIKRIVNFIKTVRLHRTLPLRIEFVLSDFCNLNCKGCTHYSPLAPKEFLSMERLRKNMEKIASVCGEEVKKLYLIGGEPLLYPELVEAMEMLRHYFPSQSLYIFTNGIALPRMDENFFETCRKLGIIIALTRYPIKFDYDKVIADLGKRGIQTEVFGDRSLENSFFRFALDPEGKRDPVVSHFKCYNFGCLSVIGDRLYPCSISGCVSHLNAAHGTDFRHAPGDFLEIDNITSVEQILKLRNRPVPFCRYCILPPDSVTYGPSRREKSEWVRE